MKEEQKCSYCKRKATYSLDAILTDRVAEMKSCNKHVILAKMEQDRILKADQMADFHKRILNRKFYQLLK